MARSLRSGVQDEGNSAEPEVRALPANLVKAESCEDLLSEIQADAVARVDQLADQLRSGEVGGRGADGSTPDALGRPLPTTATTPGSAAVATGGTPTAAMAPSSGNAAPGPT